MAAKTPTERFSTRVDQYVRFRPGYPNEVIDLLKAECGLAPRSVVADIGSGTGIFSRLLLDAGCRVFGVEPNTEMRKAGENLPASYPSFTSVAGTAEATTLPGHSVDVVTAAQAAHWFERNAARGEFVRILKPGGWVVLVWNERSVDGTPFLKEYEQLLLTYGTDYKDVRHEHTTDTIQGFFAPSPFQSAVFEITQVVDYAGLEGRLLSSSYIPDSDHPQFAPMLRELRRVFDSHQVEGHVSVPYKTRVYYGRLD
jgi:SAM-dependent methyltransferase